MVLGEFHVFKRGKFRGEVVVAPSLASSRIGGLDNPRIHKSIIDTPSINGGLEAAYLEIGVFTESPNRLRWKVWLDGFPITREYKPQYLVDMGHSFFGKVIFDVTPVYKAGESKHYVTILNSGAEPATVGHVSLVLLRRSEEAAYNYVYMTGALALAPGERGDIRAELADNPTNRGTVRVIGILPSKLSRVDVILNGSKIGFLGGAAGPDELVVEGLELERGNTLRLNHLEGDTPYFPKHFVLSSVFLAEAVYREPDIVFEGLEYVDGVLRGRISNRGESEPDSLILVVTNMGIPVGRLTLETLRPGEVHEFELKLRLPRGSHSLVVRAVSRKLSRIKYTDREIKVTVD